MIWIDSDQTDISNSGRAGLGPRTVVGAEEVVATPPPRPRGRWLKRFFWLGVTVAALVLLVILAVQMVLWSDLPRRIVVAELEKQLALRVEAEGLSTGWWGETQLKNVALSLPLGKEAFVRVPRMEVRHTGLIPLVLKRPLEVKALTLHEPAVVVHQDSTGRWDIQEVAELLGRLAGRKQAEAATSGARAKPATVVLPELTLTNGSLRMVPWEREPVEVSNIQLRGRPSGRLVWLYEAQLGENVPAQPFATLKGELATGGNWRHTVEAGVRDIEPWVKPFARWWPEGASADVEWEGRVDGPAVAGVLEIKSLSALDMAARGAMELRADRQRATVQPRTLTLDTKYPLMEQVQLHGGTISATRERVEADSVVLRVFGGTVAVGGQYGLNTGEGQARIAWSDLQPVPQATLTGDATVALAGGGGTPIESAVQRLTVNVRARAELPNGEVDAAAELRAKGRAWNDLAWEADVGRAGWSGWPPVVLTEMVARGAVTPTAITLASLTGKGPGTISGTGEWNYAEKTWAATLRAQELPVARSTDKAEFAIDARGDREKIRLQQASVRAAGVAAEATGTYVFILPKPLELEVQLRETALSPAAGGAPAVADRALRVHGRVRAFGRVVGTVAPLNMEIAGRLIANDLAVRDRVFGDAEVEVAGDLTDKALRLATTEMEALGGRWKGAVDYPFATKRAKVRVDVDNLPLADVADALKLRVPAPGGGGSATGPATAPMLGGVATGTLTVETPGFDLAAARGGGMLRIEGPQVQLPLAGGPVLAARSASARVTVENGRIEILPEAQQGTGDGPALASEDSRGDVRGGGGGRLRGRIAADVRDPTRLETEMRLEDWTMAYAGKEGFARLSGEVAGTLDVRAVSGTAQARTRAELWYRQQRVADVQAEANLAGRLVHVRRVGADILDGRLEGAARVNLDNLTGSTAEVKWENLDARRLSLFHPLLEGAVGTYSGQVTVAPDPAPRALEPLKVTATLTNRGGAFRGIPIGEGRAEGYASPARLVLNRSALDVAGGRVTLWGRTIQRDGHWTTNQLRVAADRLELNHFVQALRPGSEEMVGKISGQMDALGDPRRPEALSGGGTIRIENSDLINSDIIGAIYSAMNIGVGGRQDSGHGRMTFRFEQGDAHVTEMYYFNRGVQIRGTGVLNDVMKLPESRLDLVAAGTVRPLRDVKLPILTEIDEVIGVLQSHVTTVRATGTVAEPVVVPIVLEQAGRDLAEILMGEVHRR